MSETLMVDIMAISIMVIIVLLVISWIRGYEKPPRKIKKKRHQYLNKNDVNLIDSFRGLGKYSNGKVLREDSSKNVEHVDSLYHGSTGVRIPSADDLIIKNSNDLRKK